MSPPLQVGVQIRPNHATWGALREAWRSADQMGADSIWTFDHFFPIDGDLDGSSFECWTMLGAMAELTTRASIGALVTCYGYRNPDLLADMARTVDHAADGRLVLGLGSGWLARDYHDYGFAMPGDGDRIREMEAAIPRIRRRLGHLNPQPIGSVPLLIGGLGERLTLRVTARHADLWNGWGTPDEIRHLNKVIDNHCHDVGRDPGEVVRTVALFEPGADADYDEYVRAGAQHLILVASGPDHQIDHLQGLLRWRDERNTDREEL